MLSITNVRPAATPEEKRRQAIVAAGGGAIIVGLLAYLFWPQGNSKEENAVELTAAPPAQPTPPPIVAPQPVAPVPPAQPSASPAGLTLNGVSGAAGGAAIIGTADGQQRLVRIGRPVASGLTLKEVGPTYAVLTGNGTDYRLSLYDTGGTTPQSGAASTAASGQAANGRSTVAAQQKQQMELRLGLEPRLVMGRREGYRLKEGTMASLLQKAGLKPGDILLSMNGQPINDDERLLELPAEINAASSVELIFERRGKIQKVKYK